MTNCEYCGKKIGLLDPHTWLEKGKIAVHNDCYKKYPNKETYLESQREIQKKFEEEKKQREEGEKRIKKIKSKNDYKILLNNGKVFSLGIITVIEETYNKTLYEFEDDEEVLLATITAIGDNALITNKRILIRKTPRKTSGYQNFDIYYPDIIIDSLCNLQGYIKSVPHEMHTKFLVKFKEEQKEYFRKNPEQMLKKVGDVTDPPQYPVGERWNFEEPVPFFFYTKLGFPLLETIRKLVQRTSIDYLKICSKCNAKNERENVFCGECGEKFDEITVKKYCPECGIMNKTKNKFCEKCGTKLGD